MICFSPALHHTHIAKDSKHRKCVCCLFCRIGFINKFSVLSSPDKFNKALVPQYLKLLPYFGFNIVICNMFLLQNLRISINFTQRKINGRNCVNTIQNIDQPSSVFDIIGLQFFNVSILFNHFGRFRHPLILYNAYFSLRRNVLYQNIASDPTGSACIFS